MGTLLTRAFLRDGHEVVILGRAPASATPPNRHTLSNSPTTSYRTVVWDGMTPGDWVSELEGADVVLNLAGRSVNCRYTPENRRLILESRVNSVRVLGETIAQSAHPPHVWLQSSTATIYAHRYDTPNDEATGISGGSELNVPDTWRFSIEVAKAWECALDEAQTPHTRKVKLRSAMTMSPDRGGVFDVLLSLVRHGLGGRQGDGRQYISWIHEVDFVNAVYWLIANEAIDGAVNLCAPHPLPNAEFMRTLQQAWGTSFGLSAAAWMLEIGAYFLRTETELILKSRCVTPGRLLEGGFSFRFPTWPEAAQDLVHRWRELNTN